MDIDRKSNSNSCSIGNSEVLLQWKERRNGRADIQSPLNVASSGVDFTPQSFMPSIPKPTKHLPPRCHSDPIAYGHDAHAATEASELLRDLPRRMSCCSIDAQDWKMLCEKLKPSVTFSERSSLCVYRPDPFYVRTKSYTRQDRKNFGSEALSEAIRIKRLVMMAPGSSAKEAFKHLLKNKAISLEEVVGIEHLVLGNSASKLLKERQSHCSAVLAEQRRQRHVEKKEECDSAKKLGQFSASRSLKSAKRARIRAAMAA